MPKMALETVGKGPTRQRSSSVHDTIRVRHKITRVEIADDDENNRKRHVKSLQLDEANGDSAQVHAEAIETALPILNPDDGVEEYDYASDDYTRESDYQSSEGPDEVIVDDDTKSHISLSSGTSEPEELRIQQRPWRSFGCDTRLQWEMMYANVYELPIDGSWDLTEDYQREKDMEMMRYLEDFPMDQWLLGREQAEEACFRLHDRNRWRALGTRIYGQPPPPGFLPVATDASRLTHNQMTHQRHDASHGPPPPIMSPEQAALQRPVPSHSQKTRPSQIRVETPQQSENQRNVRVAPSHLPRPVCQPVGLPQYASSPAQATIAHAIPYGPPRHPQYPTSHGMPHDINPIQQPGVVQNASQQYVPYGILHAGAPAPGVPSTTFIHHQHMAAQGQTKTESAKPRKKKEIVFPSEPPPRPPTPPYPVRTRPIEQTRKTTSKQIVKKPARRMAEAEEYPWTRPMDFKEAKAKATWDDSIYDPQTIQDMETIRCHNAPIIEEIDMKIGEQQRTARSAKKRKRDALSSDPAASSPAPEKKNGPKKKDGGGGSDPYHSGTYAFASLEDEARAKHLGKDTPDEFIEAVQDRLIGLDTAFEVKINWNPGKKVLSADLRQGVFTIRDTVLTREQLQSTPILTRRAAECIIDFSPDLLWRSMLLRVTSEAGLGNKDVRDRFCSNGCYCDKATITKRISAALGQKQIQPKSKGYTNEEWAWYDENAKDFSRYIDFFGMRTSHRNMLKIQAAGDKRKLEIPQAEHKDEFTKEAKPEYDLSSDSLAAGQIDGANDGAEHDNNGDAVSLQDSEVLDNLDDDD